MNAQQNPFVGYLSNRMLAQFRVAGFRLFLEVVSMNSFSVQFKINYAFISSQAYILTTPNKGPIQLTALCASYGPQSLRSLLNWFDFFSTSGKPD